MTIQIRKSIVSAAISAALSFAAAGTLAAEGPHTGTMKPLEGHVFGIGDQTAVSYFVRRDSQCKLVLTVAEDTNWNDAVQFSSTRFETMVAAGKSTEYKLPGHTISFACAFDAQAMHVTATEQVAVTISR